MTDKLRTMIDTFLSERRESDGGWAPVEPQDMEQLTEILHALIAAKWGADPDGDRPVEHVLVDRTRYEGNYFFNLPYWNEAQSEQEHESILQYHMTNTRIAIGGLDRTLRNMAYRKETDR